MLAAALAAATLLAAATAAVAPPPTPAGRAALVAAGAAQRLVDAVDRRARAAFRAGVPEGGAARVALESLAPVRPGRPLRSPRCSAERPAPAEGAARDARRCRPTVSRSLSRARIAAPHRRAAVPAASPPHSTSWSEIDAALRRLGRAGLALRGLRRRAAASTRCEATRPARSARRSSSTCSARSPTRSRTATRRWQEQLAIRDAWKSLPSAPCGTSRPARAFTLAPLRRADDLRQRQHRRRPSDRPPRPRRRRGRSSLRSATARPRGTSRS